MNDNRKTGIDEGVSSSAPQSLLDRVRNINGLLAAAIALIPVAAFVAYAVFASAREKILLEVSGKMDAALVAYENGDMDGSLELLGEIREQFADVKTAGIAEYYEGAILFNQGEDERSIERMGEFLSSSQDVLLKREALFMAGFSNFRLERWADAIGYFEELFVESPTHRRRLLPLLATAYGKDGDTARADQLRKEFAATLPVPELSGLPEVSESPPETTTETPAETPQPSELPEVSEPLPETTEIPSETSN